jgi:hypothetical protein
VRGPGEAAAVGGGRRPGSGFCLVDGESTAAAGQEVALSGGCFPVPTAFSSKKKISRFVLAFLLGPCLVPKNFAKQVL